MSGTRVTLVPKLMRGFRLVRWAGGCTGSGRCTVRVSSPSAVTAVFAASKPTPKPTGPRPGSKSASEPGYYSGAFGTFFVSPGGAKVLNIQVGQANIACAPVVSGIPVLDHSFALPSAALKPDGSFGGRIVQKGVWGPYPAKITYSFSGRLAAATKNGPAKASGSLRENIALQGSTSTCTTNNVSWSATKTGPIPQKTLLVAAGNYTGSPSPPGQSLGTTLLTFQVSANRASVLSFVIAQLRIVGCSPTMTNAPVLDNNFSIASAAIRADGSFTGTATQTGVFAGLPAKITYSISGNFQGPNSNGSTTAAGMVRDDIVVTDSAGAHACTSDPLYWTATRTS